MSGARGRLRSPAAAMPVGAVVLLAVGCAAPGPRPVATTSEPPAPEALTPPAPLVTTTSEGLEVHWWLADDTASAVGAALAGRLEPALPADADLRARWEQAGLRLVRLPLTEFRQLERTLPAYRSRRRLWVGWATAWTEVFRGRHAGGAVPLIIGGERTPLPRGALRMLVRCWPAPSASGPRVRLELALQLQPDPTDDLADLLKPPEIVAPEREGRAFQTLTLEMTLDASYVYVITGETPGVRWAGAGGPPAPPPDQEPETQAAGPAVPASELLGPPVTAPLTLGQAMLTATAAETGRFDAKAVIVLLPRAPERYRLLP